MKRRSLALLAILALVAMAMAACGGDDPTPTATQAPPTPTVDPSTLTAEFDVIINMGPFGTVSVGIRDMIEAGTDGRIKLEHQDEPNAAVAVPQLLARNPERYERTLFYINEETRGLWAQGIDISGGGIVKPDPVALYGIYPAACTTITTIDPSIVTIADLAGKRIHPGTQGSVMPLIIGMAIEAAGITDQVEIIQSAKRGEDALKDQEVDAAGTGIVFGGARGSALTPSQTQIAQTTGELWLVDMPADLLDKAREANPPWKAAGLLQPLPVPKGAIRDAASVDYDIVRRDMTCPAGISVILWTSPNAEDEIIYQMMNALLDNRDMADQIFPWIARPWKERLGHIFVSQEAFHPAARRAYEEHGLTYGNEGIDKWISQQGG